MKSRLWQVVSAAVIFVMLVSMACSFGGNVATTEAPTTAPTKAPEVDVEPTKPVAPADDPGDKSGAVSTLDDVQSAVIQIQAEGTFIDPEVGLVVNGGGRGSGFIVSPDGIAITNNHVVTGAALLKVWVGGDTRKTYNAKVLGVSECSDLAVIDIQGDGFPYLEWQEDAPKTTQDVWAAGFPLGEPEYNITDGSISKLNADGETSWASVDSVLGHSAVINPGNSGGPLVNKDGQVVGVNYAGNNRNQYFAISKDEADAVLSELTDGNDVNSIGVNGQAVGNEDGSLTGIWVSSVQSGSPADKAGVEPGDIITQMEDMVLATDGTMADYCDILRTHDAGDTLNLTVLRWASQEILSGQLNGDKLAVAVTLGNDISSDVDTSSGDTGTYASYTTWTNDSGDIQIAVPDEWTEVDGSDWEATWTLTNGQQMDFTAWSITASANLDAYNSGFDESGVFFAASPDMGKIGGYLQLLYDTRTSGWYENDCDTQPSGKPTDYSDQLYEGAYDVWDNCGPNNTAVMVLVARPNDSSNNFLILVEVKITKDADFDALSNILASFQVN